MAPRYTGVSLAGLEFGDGETGVLGTNYIDNGVSHYQYWANEGANTIRLPFTWERLQPTANGPLDTAYLDLLRDAVDYATANGQTLLLDMHNYGEYFTQNFNTSPALQAAFANVWMRLANEFGDNANVWFGLMNEPHDIEPFSKWVDFAQAATNAIRGTGADNKILVSVGEWAGAHRFNDPAYHQYAVPAYEAFVDPGNNFAFEVHQYLDADNSGHSPDAVDGKGATVLQGVTDWARTKGYEIFVGEFGVAADGANADEYTDLLNFMNANGDVILGWTAWGAGEWWAEDYVYYIGDKDESGTNILDDFFAGIGSVVINGTAGNDTLNGTAADETINGLAGNDILNGNGGNDTLNGGDGTDTLNGGAGADVMAGGAGNDTYVTDGADTITEAAGAGTDLVQSSVSYTLGANLENLTLTGTGNVNGTGNALANVITGNAGNNVLNGGTGADTLAGGAGNDTYVTDGGDTITEAASAGTDLVQASVTYVLGVNVENLTLTGTGNINGTGNTLANVITGNAGNNVLNGGTGADTLAGGAGNDTYVTDGGDTITEAASAGTDLVQSSVAYVLGANVENLTLTGSAAINGTGNTLANVITGNAGNNTLDGGAGADTLDGGAGSDIFQFSTALGASNIDTINNFSVADDTIHLDRLVMTALGANGTLASAAFRSNTTGAAQDSDDRIIYNSSNGTVYYDSDGNGSAAAQALVKLSTGLAVTNADFVIIGGGAINGTSGNDTLHGTDGKDVINGLGGNDIIFGYDQDDTISGGDGNDTIYGSWGTNTIDGGSGTDTIVIEGRQSDHNLSVNGQTIQIGGPGIWTLGTTVEWISFNAPGSETDTLVDVALLMAANHIFNGTAGAETSAGTSGKDVAFGLGGNDIFVATAGNDHIFGGDDYDQIDILGPESVRANFTFIQNANGTVSMTSTAFGTDVLTGIEGVWFAAESAWASIESLALTNTVNGTAGVDYLSGTTGNDLFNALDGNDIIIADEGNDRINGGNGYDQLDIYGPNSARANFTFTQNANGTVTASSAYFGTDILSSVEGVWFSADSTWYAMDDLI